MRSFSKYLAEQKGNMMLPNRYQTRANPMLSLPSGGTENSPSKLGGGGGGGGSPFRLPGRSPGVARAAGTGATVVGGATLGNEMYKSMEGGTKQIPKSLDPTPDAPIGPEVVARTALNMIPNLKQSDAGLAARSAELRGAGAKGLAQAALNIGVPVSALVGSEFKDLPGGESLGVPPNPLAKPTQQIRTAAADLAGGTTVSDLIKSGDPAAIDFGTRGLQAFRKARIDKKQYEDDKAAAEAQPIIPGYDTRNQVLARMRGISQNDTRTNPYFGYVKKAPAKPEKSEGGGLFGGLTGLFGGKKKGS